MGAQMLERVVEAEYRAGYRAWLRFNDGVEGEVDPEPQMRGEVFEPPKDPAFFAAFEVDETLWWPNGADFAPFLHERVSAARRR